MQPFTCSCLELHVKHAVHKGRRHRFDDGLVLCAVPGSDNYGTCRQLIFPKPPVVDEAVEGFLYFEGTGVKLVHKEQVGVVTCDHSRRTEDGAAIFDAWNANQVLRRQLGAKQRDAVYADIAGKLLDEGGLADPRLAPDKDRSNGRDIKQQLCQRRGCNYMHLLIRWLKRKEVRRLKTRKAPTSACGCQGFSLNLIDRSRGCSVPSHTCQRLADRNSGQIGRLLVVREIGSLLSC